MLSPLMLLPLLAAPSLVAQPRGDAPITLDGRLNEAPWQAAAVGAGFTERTPAPGATPPADSAVRVLYDDAALYVGVELGLLPGEVPRALELTRDASRIWSDDAVTVKLDVLLDRRTTLGFVVNPAGARIDYIALDNGRVFRREFDAVWAVATRVEADRWVAEFRLPYTALGLTRRPGERVLGFNVTRDHNGRAATDDWAALPPEFGPAAATHYGELRGLQDVGVPGRPLTLIPYALVRHPGDDGWSGDTVDLRAGGDLRLRLGEDTWGELTALTDFAEVDLDDELINLDRFPLFLPEKRPFFLTGLQIFEFGERGQSQVFFSRQIGLDAAGVAQPLLGGAKLYGQTGPIQFGLINVATPATDGRPLANHAAGRLKAVFPGGGHLGIIGVTRHGLRSDDGLPTHLAGGVDGAVRLLDQRLELAGFAALTHAEGADLGDTGQVRARYQGQTTQPSLTVRRVSAAFDPAVGFVRRKDVVNTTLAVPWWTFFEGPLARLTVTPTVVVERSADLSDPRALQGTAEVALQGRTGWSVGASAGYASDVVVSGFEVVPGRLIAPGTYAGPRGELWLSSASQRNPNGSLTLTLDDGFFGGRRYGLQASAQLYAGAHLRLSATGAAARLELPGQAVAHTLAVNAGPTVAVSTTLFVDLLAQLNTVESGGRALARLRWRYLPGSDLFVVYQEDLGYAGGLASRDRRAVLKVTWWWDAVL